MSPHLPLPIAACLAMALSLSSPGKGASSFPAHAWREPPILMYHRVDVDRPRDPLGRALTVTPVQLEAQLRVLSALHLRGVSMRELYERLEAGASLDRLVVITFDDGYADQYRYAVPELIAHGDAATFYIVTGNVGAPRHLGWIELHRMADAGMDVGAHGEAHVDLTELSEQRQRDQIRGSIALLRAHAFAVDSYAYPSGRFDARTLRQMRRANVPLAVTTDAVMPPTRFTLGRVRVLGSWDAVHFAAALRSAMAKEPEIPTTP